jgi:hypothetical protein
MGLQVLQTCIREPPSDVPQCKKLFTEVARKLALQYYKAFNNLDHDTVKAIIAAAISGCPIRSHPLYEVGIRLSESACSLCSVASMFSREF